jgi:hypothetical protein
MSTAAEVKRDGGIQREGGGGGRREGGRREGVLQKSFTPYAGVGCGNFREDKKLKNKEKEEGGGGGGGGGVVEVVVEQQQQQQEEEEQTFEVRIFNFLNFLIIFQSL